MSDNPGADGGSSIEFSGAVTIRQIGEACARLRDAVQVGGPLRIDVAAVEAADLSFVQLIEAARRSRARLGGVVRLAQPAQGALRDVLERGGFLDSSNPERVEFWTHAGAAQ